MHTTYEEPRRPTSQVSRGLAVGTLVVYVATLSLIALWPTHVDAPFSPHIAWLLERVPLLTYNRLEFAANILLFVPFGFLLAVLVAPRWRWTIPLGALAVSALIEGWQHSDLAARRRAGCRGEHRRRHAGARSRRDRAPRRR